MDRIYIDGLELFAHHGVLEAEKAAGQTFFISAELRLDCRQAGMTDDLAETVNYAEVCTGIAKVFTAQTYDLIETCAEQVVAFVLHTYPQVRSVVVTVEKPQAPVGQHVRNISVQIERAWHRIYLGLGANLGDPKAALDTAAQQMACDALRVTQCSPYYKTKPVSDIPQDDYLNCVLEAQTTLPPRELMAHLLAVEAGLGRERNERWGPRTIDIDVLLYGDLVSDDPDIIIPHPRMHERLFVLEPFCAVNPYAVHPLLGQRMAELKEALTGDCVND
ncbi:MAG: 2-amino-4-hydroxy-6-hydroxymethyldihydropteridine diphosphokinase [Oscillospiraceae bacterium]|nr:2-amino-4-hydroxy-6-hydroxymethyldihydropteridine diphosphokinase [Oscillospiraceae bacterium]